MSAVADTTETAPTGRPDGSAIAAAIPLMTDETARRMRDELDRTGLTEIRDFFPADLHQRFIDEILASVDKAKPSSGYKYSLKYEDVAEHALWHLVQSPEFAAFTNKVLKGIMPYDFTPADIKMGYSILKGQGDKVPYHFDGLNALNFIIPITLPQQNPGHVDLWALPNIVGFSRTLYSRMVSKMLQWFPISQHLFPRVGVVYHERALTAFYGCRTYHGVEPAVQDKLRVIASINIRMRKDTQA